MELLRPNVHSRYELGPELTAFRRRVSIVEHPVILEELMRQRESQAVLDAERRRLLQASNRQTAPHRRSVLSLVLEVELPWGRRVRVRLGRMARGFP